MPRNRRHPHSGGNEGDTAPVFRLLLLLLGGAAAAAGIGAVWLFAVRRLVGLGLPASPALTIVEFLSVGLLAGFLVHLQLRHSTPRSIHRDLLDVAYRHTAAGIWIVDDQFRTVWSNDSMHRILGHVPPPGRHPFTYFDDESRASLEEQFRTRREGRPGTYWITLKISRGVERRALVSASPIMDSDGLFLGSVGLFIDMTDLMAERDQEAEEDRLKTIGAIVDRLDHKLNNALMVIRGQAELFLRCDPDGPDSEGLQRIVENADAIKDELEALGELKRIETEQYIGEHLMLTIPDKEE